MKKFTLSIMCVCVLAAGAAKAQQVNNSGFENWENLGAVTEEPNDWNSFKTASGALTLFAQQQIKHSTQTRPGSSGTKSCLIWSRSITVGIVVVANGNVTTGQINMGSSTATNDSNYNITRTAQPAFSETLSDTPDSLVVWVMFKPFTVGGTDSARIHATIHDTYDCKDPINTASLPHVMGEATLNFATTNNTWIRKSIPFIYNGLATSPDFILISMATNKTPGGGAGGDSLLIDDLTLIYNDASINNFVSSKNINVYTDANELVVSLSYDKQVRSDITVYNVLGQKVYNAQVNTASTTKHIATSSFQKGIYIVEIKNENGDRFTRKVAIK